MDVKQINQKLTQIFKEEKKRIVFWYDGEKEFEESLSSIHAGDATLFRLDEIGALDLKIRIETQGNNSKYLLYAPWYEPDPEKDWLFDIKLYSYTFHADKASILMSELGLENQSLRPFIKERKAFFKNQDRLDRLKKWIEPDDREDDIDLKMITVLAKAEQPDPFAILMKLLESLCKSGSFIPDEESKPWKDIETLGLAPSFWKFMAKTFGFVTESSQALSDLLIKIFVTDFSRVFYVLRFHCVFWAKFFYLICGVTVRSRQSDYSFSVCALHLRQKKLREISGLNSAHPNFSLVQFYFVKIADFRLCKGRYERSHGSFPLFVPYNGKAFHIIKMTDAEFCVFPKGSGSPAFEIIKQNKQPDLIP